MSSLTYIDILAFFCHTVDLAWVVRVVKMA